MIVIVYGKVNEALPLLSLHLWEDRGGPGPLHGGPHPHLLKSFSQLRLQPAPTAPPPFQTLWLATAKNKLKYRHTSTHHYSPGKMLPASRRVAGLRVESEGFQPNPLHTLPVHTA